MQQITKPNLSSHMEDVVIFVHGFGVRWDSRGMFTDIEKELPAKWGSVLFDFYKINGNSVIITGVGDQVERLQSIITHAREKAPNARLHIIAHSMGCIITSLAKPEIKGRIILLAPPESFGTKLERYFQRYPGAKEENGKLIIPRKDGTLTHIPLTFFTETQSIDAQKAVLELSRSHVVHLLQTTKDEVISETEYAKLQASSSIKITQIDSDHNFTDTNRAKLIKYLRETLQPR